MNSQKKPSQALRWRCAPLLATAMWAASASAHHSFAVFNMEKLVTVSGTVVDWKWVNPHSWVYVEVPKADGTTERWALECSSPNMMIRWGWNANDIHVGDKITVDVHRARDGKHVASVQTMFLAGGKIVADPMGQARLVTGDELAAGPGSVPKTPQGEVYR
jgi:hypothetical protein